MTTGPGRPAPSGSPKKGPRAGLGGNRFGAGVALLLVLALGAAAALMGSGLSAVVPQFRQVTAWLVNATQGSVSRANGLSGKTDARVRLPNAAGDRLRVLQDGSVVLVEDDTTHQVSRIDPAQLSVTQTAGFGTAGMRMVADAHVAFAVDAGRHLVQRVDPVSLAVIGGALDVGTAPGDGVLDSRDVLWLPLSERGQLLPVTATGVGGAPAAGTPVALGTGHDSLTVSLVRDAPVVVDPTAGTLTVAGASGARLTVNLPGGFSGKGAASILLPAKSDGPQVPILLAGSAQLAVVNTATGTSNAVNVGVPPGEQLGTPQQLGDRVYVPDQTAGALLVYDVASGQLLPQIKVSGTGGPLDVFLQGGLLWADSQNSADAVSVDSGGAVHRIGKYDPAVAGETTPSASTSTSSSADTVNNPAPSTGPPSATGNDQQTSADVPISHSAALPGGTPDLTSRSSSAALSPLSPKPTPHPATTPSPTMPPSSPSSQVSSQASTPPPAPPQAPTGPNATAGPGVITVRFTPSAGGTPSGYVLLGATTGSVAPATVPADGTKPYAFQVTGLSCAKQYSFTVAAVYAGGQVASGPTAPVRPCVPPSAPRQLAASFGSAEHTIPVSWAAPSSDGGDSALSYTVSWSGGATGAGQPTSGTSFTIKSLTNQRSYTVTVTAANQAGASTPPATATGLLDGPHTTYNIFNNSSLNVNMRTGPHRADTILHSFPPTAVGKRGAAVSVICQITGDSYTDTVNPAVSGDIWDYVNFNGQTGYILDLYVSTPNAVAWNFSAFSDPPLWNCT